MTVSAREVTPHLVIIRESLQTIESYRPADRTTFMESPALQDAILMRLHVIGEQMARLRHFGEVWFAEVADPS